MEPLNCKRFIQIQFLASDIVDKEDEDDAMEDGDDLNGMSDAMKAVVKRSSRKKKSTVGHSGSHIYFNRFETFGSLKDKDWTLQLPTGERALGCACGNGWCAVVTRYVVFSNH